MFATLSLPRLVFGAGALSALLGVAVAVPDAVKQLGAGEQLAAISAVART